MKHLAGLALVALLLVGGCKKTAPPTVTVDASSPVVIATSAAPVETIEVAKVDAEAPGVKASSEPVEIEPMGDVVHLGSLLLWFIGDGDAFSSIYIADEKAKKKAHLVRRTSGEVNDLRIVKMEDGDYAVGWSSTLLNGGGQVTAVAFVSADLSKVSAPATLALLTKGAFQPHIAMVKNPKGGVLVAHEAASPENTVVFQVSSVSPAGKVSKIDAKKINGGGSADVWMITLDDDRGVLVFGSAMAGGRVTDSMLVPWTAGDPAPPFANIPLCYGIAGITPELLRGSNGEIVSLCIDLRYGDHLDKCVKAVKDDPERCLRVAVSSKTGDAITPAKDFDTPVSKVACSGKNVQLSFPGGSVTLASPSQHVSDWLKKKCD